MRTICFVFFTFLLFSFLGPWSVVPGPVFAQSPNQCQMPKPLPTLICKEGGDFLCVNTPPGGVKESFVLLKGRLNLEQTALASFSVSTQHEYTNEIDHLKLAEPIKENCWEPILSAETNFCLEPGGKFAVFVPLPELGPYTISVAASRSEGVSMQKTVRTSFVTAPTVTSEIATYDPGTTHAQVTLDLLKSCEQRETCDFFGTTTGAVWVTVANQVSGEPPVEVRCATNVTQGGAGLFVIGVPLLPGENHLDITVCGPHTGFVPENCHHIVPPPFYLPGERAAIKEISMETNGSIAFRIAGFSQESCDETVQAAWNLGMPQKVCPDPQGRYAIHFQPKAGYNIVSITANLPNQRLTETFSFAHGNILTPFAADGSVLPETKRRLRDAFQVALSQEFLNETIAKVKPDLAAWIQDLSGKLGQESGENSENPTEAEVEKVKAALGYCPQSGKLSDLRIKMMGQPEIGSFTLHPLQFEPQKISWGLEASDVSLAVQLYKDVDRDSRPDIDPLPLKIGFKKLKMRPALEVASLSDFPVLLKLTSPDTDCSYKRRGACYGFPALLTPDAFEGAANAAGAFVTCDHSQGVSKKMDKICHGLNVIDRQTGGVIQEKILDVLNKTFACDGSAILTAKLQKGFPVGLESLKIEREGILATFFSQFGSQEIFQSWPKKLRNPRTGILVSPQRGGMAQVPANLEGLLFDLNLATISQMFWQGFSLKIDEAFFAEQGFDFASQCVDGEEPDPLCYLRPRAQEILGPPISDYGYLQPDEPLVLTLTPSHAFPLHLDVLSGNKLAIEMADWELEIASLETPLITAKISALLVVEVSQPDPFLMTLKTIKEESRIWVSSKAGSNATVIPGSLLLSNLEEKLKFAIDNFSQAGKEIKIPIDRSMIFPADSLLNRLGLSEIIYSPEGFVLDWNPNQNRLELLLNPVLKAVIPAKAGIQ